MSSQTSSIARTATDAAVAAAWAQWAALGAAAVPRGGATAWTIVDPEALFLASSAFAANERRLPDVAAGWATGGARLLSFRRLRSLMGTYPAADHDSARALVAWAEAQVRGGAGAPRKGGDVPVATKSGGPLRVDAGAALMLRLRAAFGVAAKADVLTFLLGTHGAASSLRNVAAAVGYTTRAVRTATEEMALAGIVEEIAGSPLAYWADDKGWARFLELRRPGALRDAPPEVPEWRAWSAVYPFLAYVRAWEAEAEASGWSEYVASSRARDMVEAHGAGLRRAGIAVPGPRARRGAGYLEDFQELVERTADWTRDGAQRPGD